MALVRNPITGEMEDDGQGEVGQPMAPVVRENKNVTTTTSRPVVTPGFTKAAAALDATAPEAIANAQQEAALHAEQAKVQADADARAAAAAAEQEKRMQAQHEAMQAEVQRRKAIADADEQKLRATADKDFHADESTGDKVRGIVGMLISGIGASMQGPGAVNLASAKLDKVHEREMAKQKENFARLEKQAARSGAAVNDAYAAGDREQEYLSTAAVVARQKELAITKSMMASTGKKQAEIEGNALVLAQKQKLAQAQMEREKLLTKNSQTTVTRNTVTTSGGADGAGGAGGRGGRAGGKLTGPQEDAAGSLGVLAANLERMDDLRKRGVNIDAKTAQRIQDDDLATQAANSSAKSGVMGSLGVGIARSIPGLNAAVPRDKLQSLTPDQRALYQANDQARGQVLKVMSGLGVTDAERVASEQGFLPGPFDSPADSAEKIRRAVTFGRELSVKAGAAGPAIAERFNRVEPADPFAAKPPAELTPADRPPPAGMVRKVHPRTGALINVDPKTGRWEQAH